MCASAQAQIVAQDTLATDTNMVVEASGLALDTTIAIDTLRAKTEISGTDLLLLDLLAQQSREIAQRDSLQRIADSLYRDSLLLALYTRDSLLFAQVQYLQDSLQGIRDSIYTLRADELARIAYEDSIAEATRKQDSVARLMAAIKDMPEMHISRSLIQDTEEDLKEMKALQKHIYSPWRMDATIQLQCSQSYITDNWYQGGNKLNLSVLGIAKGNVVYKKDKFLWENVGEWRVGMANVPNDTLRKFNINDDNFRLYTKFGYQLIKQLYLSSSAELKASLFNTWNANTNTLKTTFLTPLRFNLDLGIDYRPVNGLSIVIAPASYKLLYAKRIDDKIDEAALGLPAGKNILHDVGSSMRIKGKWAPLREIVLETELYFYTNYTEDIEVDWVTDCNFIINRFLSTRVSLHPRYDNRENKRIQFKELVSIGFAHKFH